MDLTVHLTLEGDWQRCTQETCALKFHIPGLTVAEARAIPRALLEPILEAANPPTFETSSGQKIWHDEHQQMHRDYDLPAVIEANGTRRWYQHGQLHREFDPAVIYSNGYQEWWYLDEYIEDPLDGE